jgi:hypothetical protein
VITFRQVADQRPDTGTGTGSGSPHEVPTDLPAQRELWPEPVERQPAVQAPLPRYRRIGD